MPAVLIVLAIAMVRTDIMPISYAALLMSAVALGLLLWRRWVLLAVLLSGMVIGIADLALDARAMQVDKSWLEDALVVTATIRSVQNFPAFTRLQVSHIKRSDGAMLGGEGLLFLYPRASRGKKTEQSIRQHPQAFNPGDQIEARVHLHTPRNHLNPGRFDYRAWCFDRHISVLGSVSPEVKLLYSEDSWLESARQRIRRAIAGVNPEAKGILSAVILGDRSQVSASANDAFAATGTAHLLAISGMHVGMAAAWMFALCWLILTRREAWIVNFPVRKLSLLAGLVSAFIYASLAGWPLPAVRAGIMLAAGVLAWHMAARTEPLNILMAALIVMLLFDPTAISSVSLWLSFLATAGILFWAGHLRSGKAQGIFAKSKMGYMANAARRLFLVSLLAILATFPLIVSVFGRIPLYGMPANLILVPIYGLFVMPLGLAGEVAAVLGMNDLAAWLFQICGMGIGLSLDLISGMAALPSGRLWAVSPGRLPNLLYALGAAGVFLLLKKPVRLPAGLLAFMVVAVYLFMVLTERTVEKPTWVVWDVGQGASSTLLLPREKVLVIDVPGRDGSRFNGGTQVASGLRSMGLTHVDVLLLTHAQSDHLGGALSLMQQVNSLGEIWFPDVPLAHKDKRVILILSAAKKRGIRVRWLAEGDIINIGGEKSGVRMNVLWPPRNHAPRNPNNSSLVMTVVLSNGVKLLWPGDIEAEAEAGILKEYPAGVDAMLVPHHGSRTSSTENFIRALNPSLSIAQTGFHNRYGFPHHDVVTRYREEGSRVLNSADGAVFASWPDGSGSVEVERWGEKAGMRREVALQWWALQW